MPISAPDCGIMLPQTCLTPAYNVPRPTATLASDHDLTPTSDVIHISHSPLSPQAVPPSTPPTFPCTQTGLWRTQSSAHFSAALPQSTH